ncbi:xanthan biosynthesis protein XanB [Synergistales bacterium]|nr:xanthan biosynthesis protein XanB [Synergistales bacterium]
MSERNIYGVILAGGSGTRLWPKSRAELPKQFLSLTGKNTMLQDTVLRMMSVMPEENIRVVADAKWKSLVDYQAREVSGVLEDFLIKEPCARNTAPAILLACASLLKEGALPSDIVIVTPSDHLVKDVASFKDALTQAVVAASLDYIVTLGITPTHPETGYGYIKRARGERLKETAAFEVECFVEKPDGAKAEEYIKSGEYFWNGGLFVFTLRALERELEKTSPLLFDAAKGGYDSLSARFESLLSVSFDYAVMEKASRVAMVELDAGWSDVGSWDSLRDILDKDELGNAFLGDVLSLDSSDCFVESPGRLTAISGVEGLIVVDSPDALFITKSGSSQDVRDIVERLKKDGRKEATQATENARPWGLYKIICESDRFKIKRIVITPGKRLSMQYHCHRLEHWVVVRGTALVTIDDKESFIHEGESVFIPKNAAHRLENPGKIDLEIVEVQSGEYLGEDDIVRLADDFART